ncbi:hypothetical protein BATDEDRAFT_29442 [Batrachochytrium dendrobatidis JAM81]|uniref:Uncharacterized protein n=2 Tax=Batrachochytrium dendrobatidis TaxID=109871 RepID=F4NX93_BATDJ|nr:uncharacterized protein BATDEDRAFT_29442 [Batrachochytrium dendrobatidis JAM81]EGF82632.1 hypothetical protein BATDEDRAFT_29442 [Batrachochytrium dendrobatidis JAM81]|eukprot:XP_006676732.1 hypothetical protein BATDEDRAFT_29442 [Batrachochytrium dendrobatidis JAM81]
MIQEKDDPRLLILGSGDSGKTTLLKQMRLFYGEGFTLEEIEAYRLLLLENVINCMSAYLALCDHLNLPIIHQHERLHYVSYSHAGRSYLPADLPPIISILWNEPSVQQVVLLGPNYHIQDTAPYFLSRVETIGKVGYKPTNQDILHVRAPTLAVSETIFKIGIHHYRLFDVGGQRGLRKQWAPFFDNCHSILFVTSIASYDQTLEEEREHSVNRLHDAIELFGGVINNRILQNSEVLLFLNKKDIFEEKLKHLPFSKFFPRYRGPNDPESIARYVAALFKAQRWDQNRKIMIHRTCCTDTRNMELVVARLIEGLTKSALSRIGTI